MTRRYYISEIPPVGSIATLQDSEGLHAIKVMRVQTDEQIELFDGRGNQASATIVAVSRKECSCRIDTLMAVDREPSISLTLAVALPKPDRCRELIERLTELGVHRLVPLVASHTQRGPSASLLEKLRRAVVEACKQSGRNVLMDIAEPIPLGAFLAFPSDDAAKIIAHPRGQPLDHAEVDSVIAAKILIGPEGGWTDDEVAQAIDVGYRRVDLGRRIFRIETAAVYLAARLIDS